MAIDSLTSVIQAFSALDRCDRCPARALVRAQFLNGDLLFCGHHAKELGNVLFIKALSVYDPDGIVSL
jgi:hypothetical protein